MDNEQKNDINAKIEALLSGREKLTVEEMEKLTERMDSAIHESIQLNSEAFKTEILRDEVKSTLDKAAEYWVKGMDLSNGIGKLIYEKQQELDGMKAQLAEMKKSIDPSEKDKLEGRMAEINKTLPALVLKWAEEKNKLDQAGVRPDSDITKDNIAGISKVESIGAIAEALKDERLAIAEKLKTIDAELSRNTAELQPKIDELEQKITSLQEDIDRMGKIKADLDRSLEERMPEISEMTLKLQGHEARLAELDEALKANTEEVKALKNLHLASKGITPEGFEAIGRCEHSRWELTREKVKQEVIGFARNFTNEIKEQAVGLLRDVAEDIKREATSIAMSIESCKQYAISEMKKNITIAPLADDPNIPHDDKDKESKLGKFVRTAGEIHRNNNDIKYQKGQIRSLRSELTREQDKQKYMTTEEREGAVNLQSFRDEISRKETRIDELKARNDDLKHGKSKSDDMTR